MSGMFFTEQEWRELEYASVAEQITRHIATESSASIDEHLQAYADLTLAYDNISNHQQSTRFSDEWENMGGDITFGDHGDFSTQDYLHIWDEQEMIHDINAFESGMNTQVYLAHSLSNTCNTFIDLTKIGPNYSTADSIYGKVYIPKHLSHFITKELNTRTAFCEITFNGCEESRISANIRMPWKLTKVL